MTIPSGANPIALSGNINTEFGPNGPAPAPGSLLAYRKYPGGTRVGATPLTTPIPTGTPISIRSFAGTQSGYPKTTSTFATGAATVTIPSGVRTINVDVWGGGGGGSQGRTIMCCSEFGTGGAGGGLARSSFPITGPSWGLTISYSVGAAGAGNPGLSPTPAAGQVGQASSAQSGTYAIPAMTGGGGGAGAGGVGGPATGGTISNTTGASASPLCGIGATGLAGICSYRSGAGGNAGFGSTGVGQPGQSGRVLFTWS